MAADPSTFPATVRGEPVESHATASTHIAVLLAAGASRRLGQPKQLLTRDGVPLVRTMALALAQTCPRQLIVVLGARADDVAQALGEVPHRAVINPDFADGLSTSLQCAAKALAHSDIPVLIAACDQPALSALHLEHLLHAARNAPEQCAATIHGDHLGIPAVVAGYVFQQSHALHGDRGLGGWLSATEGVARVDAPALEFDIDTPEHLAAARARGWVD
jgi:molybdenum cofactor cytidylyltransferase